VQSNKHKKQETGKKERKLVNNSASVWPLIPHDGDRQESALVEANSYVFVLSAYFSLVVRSFQFSHQVFYEIMYLYGLRHMYE